MFKYIQSFNCIRALFLLLVTLLSAEGCRGKQDSDGYSCLLLTEEHDDGANGTLEYRESYTYDSADNLLVGEGYIDQDYADIIYFRDTYIYDTNGNMLRMERDLGPDGTLDYHTVYTYDTDNNILTFKYYIRDIIDQSYSWTYDADGNKLTFDFYRNNGEFYESGHESYTYDADGKILTREDDNDADGHVDAIYAYTYIYDTNGDVLTQEVDYDADGSIDYRYNYTYDTDGNILTCEGGPNITVDYRYIYTYNTNGNMLTEGLDVDANGSVDYLNTYTYDC